MRAPVVPMVVAALLAAPAARAQPVSEPSGPHTYLELQLGAFLPGGDFDQLDPGAAASGTFGARFTRTVAAEATVGWYSAAAAQGGGELSLNVVPVLVSLRLVLPVEALELSARAGAGVHFAALHASGLGDASDTDTAFGWHLGASAAYELSRTMLVGVDVLATFATADFGGGGRSIDGIQVSARLGYRF